MGIYSCRISGEYVHSYKNTIDKDLYDLTKMYTLESSIIHLIMFNSSNKAKIILSVI